MLNLPIENYTQYGQLRIQFYHIFMNIAFTI